MWKKYVCLLVLSLSTQWLEVAARRFRSDSSAIDWPRTASVQPNEDPRNSSERVITRSLGYKQKMSYKILQKIQKLYR
jgi:hypothetical protein